MYKSKLYNIALVFALIAGIGILSGCTHRSPEKRADWITGKIASKLDLNDAQKKELNSLKDVLMEEKKEMHQSRMTIHDELIKQLGMDKIDQENMINVIKAEETRLNENIPTLVERLAVFSDSLTPDQRVKLIEMIKKWERHKGKYHRY